MRIRECEDPPSDHPSWWCTDTEERSCRTANCPVELIGGNGISYGNLFVTNDKGYFGPVCDDDSLLTSAEMILTLENRELIHFGFLRRGFVEKELIHNT